MTRVASGGEGRPGSWMPISKQPRSGDAAAAILAGRPGGHRAVPRARALLARGRAALPAMSRAAWTLADQAILSAGMFLLNVVSARHLPPEEYGEFALLMGAILTMQMVLASLVFHPISIRRGVAAAEARDGLTAASLVVAACLCAPLALVLAAGMLVYDLGDIVVPAICYFAAWQLQDTVRRHLLADLRHRDAAATDAVSMIAQSSLALGLAARGELSLPHLLGGNALVLAIVGAMQLVQVGVPRRWPDGIGLVARDFWSAGKWSLSSNAVSAIRFQVVPWVLASMFGAGATGAFQAACNIVNVVNPVLTGLCNIIPQIAAREAKAGAGRAWKAARLYALLGAPLVACGYLLAFAVPELLLRLLYGPASPYGGLGLEIRLLVAASALGYAVEMTCAFFHGIDQARAAFRVNAYGAAATIVAGVPLAWSFGVTGACAALLAVSLVRLVAARRGLARTIRPDPR